MKHLAVLGSTGSIGRSTLSVVEQFEDRFAIRALAAGRNLEQLRAQIIRHRPAIVAVADPEDAASLAREFPATRCVAEADGLEEVACCDEVEMVVSALVGFIGISPTVKAIRAGKDIALANKEILAVAGDLFTAEVERSGVNLLPVDSEHAALHQIISGTPSGAISRLVLTASGGPFRTWSSHRMGQASVADALAHPTWNMGPKVTVDSATMMNKGLEIIEAHHLFGVPEERIDVVVHPESVIHSMVENIDGTTIAQMSPNDMRFPILYALSRTERLDSHLPGLDLATISTMTFEPPDEEKFPSIELARSALRDGGEMPAVLNAANEVAVSAFLEGACTLGAVPQLVASALDRWRERNRPLQSLQQVEAVDLEARKLTREGIRKYQRVEVGSENR
jgi:1-deoxy-D-xylulose-5-phosphate reductoisomerase